MSSPPYSRFGSASSAGEGRTEVCLRSALVSNGSVSVRLALVSGGSVWIRSALVFGRSILIWPVLVVVGVFAGTILPIYVFLRWVTVAGLVC
jgi:hypothetical protein